MYARLPALDFTLFIKTFYFKTILDLQKVTKIEERSYKSFTELPLMLATYITMVQLSKSGN